MSKKRRKSDRCLNCGSKLEVSFEYCPHCGQENDDRQISFGRLFVDFFSNYFSLDSKFGRSVKPFFLQPGVLTREFMEGKRVKYANPIRLYLVISLIHFYLFSLTMDNRSDNNEGIVKTTPSKSEVVGDSIRTQVDSTLALYNLDVPDTVITDDKSFFFMTGAEWKTVQEMTKKDGMRHSVEEIEEAIENEKKEPIPQYLSRKLIKLMNSEMHSINMYIVSKIPGVMFFLLPFYALLLKIFFSKKLYINHLVHSLHIHSFTFLVLSLLWISELISESFSDSISIFVPFILMLYIVLSFKNAYNIKIGKAIGRVFATGFIYTFIVGVGLLFGVLISLLLY